MKLIAVCELPDGSNVQVQGLLLVPHSASGLTTAQPVLAHTRPIAPPEVAEMFVKLCQAGMIEVPMQLPDGTVIWRQVTAFQFRLAAPNANQNGAGARRIIVPGG